MRSYLMTGSFWAGAAERAVKTAAQTLIAQMAATQVIDAFHIDYKTAAGVALFAAMLSVLMSIGSAPIGPAGPSMVNDRPNPNVPGDADRVDPPGAVQFRPGRAGIGDHRAEP